MREHISDTGDLESTGSLSFACDEGETDEHPVTKQMVACTDTSHSSSSDLTEGSLELNDLIKVEDPITTFTSTSPPDGSGVCRNGYVIV